MIPDPRWWAPLAKGLSSQTVAGLFVASVVLLLLDSLGIISLAAVHVLLPIAIALVAVASAAFLAGGEIYDRYKEHQKTTKLSARRQVRRAERDATRAEAEAAVLERIDYLSEGELRYIAEALRRGEQTFTAWVSSSHVASLEMKRFIISPAGEYNTSSFPFVFDDFVGKALLAHKDDLIAKDDENSARSKRKRPRERGGERSDVRPQHHHRALPRRRRRLRAARRLGRGGRSFGAAGAVGFLTQAGVVLGFIAQRRGWWSSNRPGLERWQMT